MIGTDEKKCKNCRYWQDYTYRIYMANRDPESGTKLGLTVLKGNTSELRPCAYNPSPNVEVRQMVYVGEAYSCSDFKRADH